MKKKTMFDPRNLFVSLDEAQKKIRKHGLVITGDLGAGKSDVINIISEWTTLEIFSVGEMFKKEAMVRGLTLDEFHDFMKKDPLFDQEIDAMQVEYLKKNTDYVVDSRLGRLFEPRAYSVYLQVDPMIGAQRIWDSIKTDPNRLAESTYTSVEDVLEKNEKRVKSELARYKELYNFNHRDQSLYNLVINTNKPNEQKKTANTILQVFKAWRTETGIRLV